jgi:hypothetical protein
LGNAEGYLCKGHGGGKKGDKGNKKSSHGQKNGCWRQVARKHTEACIFAGV